VWSATGAITRCRAFSSLDQFLCLAFAQLTYRESLRAQQPKLYHMGFRGPVSRATLAYANEHRNWRLFADFAQGLIHTARALYHDEPFGVELAETVYAFDSTTIDLCLSLFPWAHSAAQERHQDAYPARSARPHSDQCLCDRRPSPRRQPAGRTASRGGSLLPARSGYLDFARLYVFTQAFAFFITRAKQNTQFYRRLSHPIDRATGLRSDQTILLTGPKTARLYPAPLRRIHYFDAERTCGSFFLTNNFLLPALTIAQLYRARWQVELFFRWVKQHLRLKAFYGTSRTP